MQNFRLILTFLGTVAIAVAAYTFFPSATAKLNIAQGAAILYYNSPAALQIDDQIYVGYVTANGLVEVATIDVNKHNISRLIAIHDYGKPDDHAAPALWPDGEDILVATAFHSSDLFLYRVSKGGAVSQLCRWAGRFSYPRLDEVDGETWLYVRNDPNKAGNLAIIRSPETCAPEEIIFTTTVENYLYATVPDGDRVAWSVYDLATGKHAGGFINAESVALSSSPYDETLMWSVVGEYYSATRFKDSFACCKVGEMVAELYKGMELIFSSAATASPYYPTGIVLSKAANEGIFPTDDQKIERRSLPTLAKLPTCEQRAEINSRAQFILNGGGSYVWMEYTPPIAGRQYDTASIALCLISG